MQTKPKTHGRQRLALALAAVVVVLALVVGLGSNYLVEYAIGRSGDGGDRQVALEVEPGADTVQAVIAANKAAQEDRNQAFAAAHPGQRVGVTAADGLDLSGLYYQKDSHDWVIALHGYRGSCEDSLRLAQPYYDAGFQVVMPDLRACGESEGRYVGMGWLDRKDVLAWIDWVVAQDPEARIVVHGISMGAAATMMTAGEPTPDNVRAFVEDCGYTSVWDVFSSELQLRFGLPEFPLLYTASALADAKAGYNFAEASALEQVRRCEKPMLFIHGTADDFIPYAMMDILYQAKPGTDKAALTAEGAGHGEAMYALGDTYWQTVLDFVRPYLAA